jgi:hypothetical protein
MAAKCAKYDLHVGNSSKLLEKVTWEEGEDGVLGCHDLVGRISRIFSYLARSSFVHIERLWKGLIYVDISGNLRRRGRSKDLSDIKVFEAL